MALGNLENEIINTIRGLSMDAVETANSGHPGAPMGLAPVAWTLYDKVMNFNPENPNWLNRDRFVLSAGHASMLMYSILHLTGYDVTLDDIKKFRQLGSRCPGHLEYGMTAGVETTTGPLGQGAATSVGMAIAERWLSNRYNRPDFDILDYRTYAILGDGCMMEGITSEAASLAGHLGLGKLIWLYDSNKITIEGSTDVAFTEDVAARFRAYGWDVLLVEDANDTVAVEKALLVAKAEEGRPSLVIVKSHIAFGSPNLQDSSNAHGSPLGVEEVVLTKEVLGLDPKIFFYVSQEVQDYTSQTVLRCVEKQKGWDLLFKAYQSIFTKEAAELKMILEGELPGTWKNGILNFDVSEKGLASRVSNGEILNALAVEIPWMMGGSADLGPSTKTVLKNGGWFQKVSPDGRNIHFGVREHAMGAIANGLALSGLWAFCSTFFVFSDYMRASIRLSALMKLPVAYIFTHDSIFVGEDGPTHQPVEHLASFRAMQGVDVYRPGDANELSALWKYFIRSGDRPVLFVLSRQDMPTFDREVCGDASLAVRGGYVLREGTKSPELIIIATGSEVALALEAQGELEKRGVATRVVSMPSQELFDRQDEAWKESVLPSDVKKRMVIEAGSSYGWHKYLLTTDPNAFVCMDGFGESAPDKALAEEFGFTCQNILMQFDKL